MAMLRMRFMMGRVVNRFMSCMVRWDFMARGCTMAGRIYSREVVLLHGLGVLHGEEVLHGEGVHCAGREVLHGGRYFTVGRG